MNDCYLTADDVAARLRVSKSWVYKHKRMLGGVQIGERLWRFPEAGVDAFVSRRPRGGVPVRRPVRRPVARVWRLS